MFSSLSIFLTCETTLSRPGAQTHSAPALPPCIVVLSCLNKWPVRWWMLLSFLHSAAVLAGGESMRSPRRLSSSLYPCHISHTHTPTHTHTPATTAWESQRHLIHHSVCLRKDSERGWGTFFPPLIYMNGQVGVVCSVMYSVLWVWNDPGLNSKTEIDLYKAEISQQMTCNCPY